MFGGGCNHLHFVPNKYIIFNFIFFIFCVFSSFLLCSMFIRSFHFSLPFMTCFQYTKILYFSHENHSSPSPSMQILINTRTYITSSSANNICINLYNIWRLNHMLETQGRLNTLLRQFLMMRKFAFAYRLFIRLVYRLKWIKSNYSIDLVTRSHTADCQVLEQTLVSTIVM